MMRLEKKLDCFWSYISDNKDSELTISDRKNSTNLFHLRLKRNGVGGSSGGSSNGSGNGIERWQYSFTDYHIDGNVWGSAGGAFILIPSSRTLLDQENVFDDDGGGSPGFEYIMKPFFHDYSCHSYTPSLRSISLSFIHIKINHYVPPNRWRWQNLPIGQSPFADFGYEDVNHVK